MSTQLVPIRAGITTREDFGGQQVQRAAERDTSAVQAREEAIIKAEYVMAERHPRNWQDVRQEMLSHCRRPRFAEISRYAKPVGGKMVDGKWKEEKATGWTARFAETLRQEMGNIKPVTDVTFEDDMIRMVRIGVVDLQKNIPRYRTVTFAKAVEKRGKKVSGKSGAPDSFNPPEGREVISQRLNSYGEPTFLVKATDDEMRNKVNSEESKTQRDFTLALCPRDILEDCLDEIEKALEKDASDDPAAAVKRALDAMRKDFGLIPSEVEQYIGRATAQFTALDIRELRELYSAMRDGQTTFQEAMKARFHHVDDGEGEPVLTREQVAEKKLAAMKAAGLKEVTPGSQVLKAECVWADKKSMNADFLKIKAAIGDEFFDEVLKKHGIMLGTAVPGDATVAAYADMSAMREQMAG